MPIAPAALSSARFEPLRDDELSLAALLDLFEDEQPGAPSASERPFPLGRPLLGRPFLGRPFLRRPWPGLRVWVRECRQRAARWGTGPEGAWRAW